MNRIKIISAEMFWTGLAVFFILWIMEAIIPGLAEHAVNRKLMLSLIIVTGLAGLIYYPDDSLGASPSQIDVNHPDNR